jgi:putative membrane protein
MQILIVWLVSAVLIFVLANILPGITVASFVTAFVVAVVLGLVNAVIRPIILLLTLPINILTLGLFTFVINALMVLLVAAIVPGFGVASFWWAMLFSIILSVANAIVRNR